MLLRCSMHSLHTHTETLIALYISTTTTTVLLFTRSSSSMDVLQKGTSHASHKGRHVIGAVQRRDQFVHGRVLQHGRLAIHDGPQFVGRFQAEGVLLVGLGGIQLGKRESVCAISKKRAKKKEATKSVSFTSFVRVRGQQTAISMI